MAEKRTRPTITEGDGDPRHGTDNGYDNLRCRCPACRAAWAVVVQRRKAKRVERGAVDPSVVPHGTKGGYYNWGCRCRLCRDAAGYEKERGMGAGFYVRRLMSQITVDPDTGCWEWQGTRDDRGYGLVEMWGRRWRVHRAMYALRHDHPGDLFVCHHCDNPPCARPAHLFLGTHADNMRDMTTKRRHKSQRAAKSPR